MAKKDSREVKQGARAASFWLSAAGIIVLFAIAVLLNSLSKSELRSARLDLTQEKVYSVSDGSRKILGAIVQPLTLKFYFSKTDSTEFPFIKLYGERIADFLREYESAAHGKIKLEIYDPRPDSEDEEWAQKYGLSAIPTRTNEHLFLGLAGVNASGGEDIVPVFDPQRQEFLEYDITKMIYALTTIKKPVVGILSSLNLQESPLAPGQMPEMEDEGGQGWFFLQQLGEAAEVRHLKADLTKIEPEITTLLVVHPKNLSDQVLYAIDQFVMRGGRLLVFVDPYCQSDRGNADPNNPMAAAMSDKSSSLNKLLSKWGVELIEKKVVADVDLSTKVSSGRQSAPQTFVSWLTLRRPNFSSGDIVTSSLESVLLPWSGALKVTKLDGVESEVLMKSSKTAMLLDESSYRYNGGDPDTLLRNFSPTGEEYPLAVRIRGKLKSNFPEGKPQAAAAAAQAAETQLDKEHLGESKEKSNVIVVADVDLLADRFAVAVQNIFGARLARLLNDNVSFVQNAVENMLGSDALISIRARGGFARNFTRVQAMENRAQMRFQQEQMVFEAQLNAANQRLGELQASGKQGEKQVFTKAVMDEMKNLREQRREAQQRLRQVRRNLRVDIERLGEWLFVLNTFFIPLLLVIGSLVYYSSQHKAK